MLNNKKFYKGQDIIDSYNIGNVAFAEVIITSTNWRWSGRFYKLPKTDNILINYGEIIPNNITDFNVEIPTEQFTTRAINNLNVSYTVTIKGSTTINDSFIASNSYRYNKKYTEGLNKTVSRGQICTFVIDTYGNDADYNSNFYYYEKGVKKYFPKLQLMTSPSLYIIKTDNLDSLRFNGVDVKISNDVSKYSVFYLNEVGGVDWVSGNKASFKNTETENEYLELEILSGLTVKKEKRLTKQSVTSTFNLKSLLMTRDEYNANSQLFNTTKCFLSYNGEVSEVFVTTTGFTEKTSRSDKLVQLEVSVQTKKESIRYGQLIY